MLFLQPAFSWLYILICLHRLKYFTSYSSLLVEKRFLILIGVQPARPSVVYFTPGCSFLISNSTTSASSRCCKGPTLWAESDVAASDSELSLTSESIVAEESWELGGGREACGGLLLWGESAIVTSDSVLTLTSESSLSSGPTVKRGSWLVGGNGESWELVGGNGSSPSTPADVAPEEQDPGEELGGWAPVRTGWWDASVPSRENVGIRGLLRCCLLTVIVVKFPESGLALDFLLLCLCRRRRWVVQATGQKKDTEKPASERQDDHFALSGRRPPCCNSITRETGKPRLDSWAYCPSNTQTRIVAPDAILSGLYVHREILWEIIRQHGTLRDIIDPMGLYETAWDTDTIGDIVRHYETPWDIMGHHETAWHTTIHYGCNRTVWGNMRHETLWETKGDIMRYYETAWDTTRHYRSNWTVWDSMRHYETAWDTTRHYRCNGTVWESMRNWDKRRHHEILWVSMKHY